MRLLSYNIKVNSRSTKINLIPIGDVHCGSKNSNEDKLKKLVEWILKQKDTYVILMGDLIEAINVSDPRFDIDSLIEGGKEVNNLLFRQIDRIVKLLKPIKGKIIGALEGNHEAKAKQKYHSDVTSIICEKLGIENLTYSALIRLRISRQKGNGRIITIYAHHGFGGGNTIGGKLNKISKLATNFDANIYLMGHVHDKYVFASEQLAISQRGEPRLIANKKVFALTGSFFETYVDGYSSYAEKMAYAPIPTGVIKLVIVPFKITCINGKVIDLPIDIHPSL
jgi:predicted phosphodiesterase